MTTPVIFHLDLDSFFVSAERLREPRLRGRPVAVGGQGPRGVISSASYEARKFGVRSAMPTAQALRLCPRLLLCPPDPGYYGELSRKVFAIVAEIAPVWEQVSVDEAFLDMTGTASLFGPPREAAELLRARIRQGTGLTASIGIASNRSVAKVAGDFCKPDRVHEVPPGGESEFLAPLPVRVLPGCGKKTQEWLEARGIFRVADLQRYGGAPEWLRDAALGKGGTRFHEPAKTRSISRENTFSADVSDARALKHELWLQCAELGRSLREEGAYAEAVRLKLRYPPFETVLRSRVLAMPTRVDSEIYGAVEKLFDENWVAGAPVRLIGAGCVIGEGRGQFGLFEDPHLGRKREELDRLKDSLRRKFGSQAIGTGRDFEG